MPAQTQNQAACDGAVPPATGDETVAGIVERFHLAVVKTDKAYFYQDEYAHKGCPAAEGCQSRAYLVQGDKVVSLLERDGWVCSYYRRDPKRKEHVGWIKADSVETAAPVTASLESWAADWKTDNADIAISQGTRPGTLKFAGNAIWKGSAPGQINEGDFEDEGVPDGNQFHHRDGDCELQLRWMDEYLIAVDNNACGGWHVTFSGIYVKAATKKSH
jgi:hypothetical protein